MTSTIRVLIVDDHPMIRDGITALLCGQPDIELVGEASNGAEAFEKFRELAPDITLMDLQMPGISGLEAIKAIRSFAPNARILVLTTYPGDANAARALKAGAAGYLLKNGIRGELVDSIRSIHAGRYAVSPEIANELVTYVLSEPLTDREVATLVLVAQGLANKQIAYELNLSNETVKAHLKAIFEKLDVHDRTHAVTVAARRGYINLYS